MSTNIQVKVPAIGDFEEVAVVEVLVAPGDRVEKEASLITLESDKATMEIPSPEAGKVVALKVEVGAKVSEGDPILTLEAAAANLATRPLRPYRRVSEALSSALEPAYTRSVDEGPGSGNRVTILIAFGLERNHTMNTAGIDVSAKTVTVVISREGRSGKPREFKNMPQGHTALSNVLRKTRVTRVCLEATGSYHLDLAVALDDAGLEVMVIKRCPPGKREARGG